MSQCLQIALILLKSFTFGGRLFLYVLLFGSANCFFWGVTFNVAPYSNNGTPPTPSTSSASALCNRRCRRRCQGCHHLPTLLPKSHQQSLQYSDPPLKWKEDKKTFTRQATVRPWGIRIVQRHVSNNTSFAIPCSFFPFFFFFYYCSNFPLFVFLFFF